MRVLVFSIINAIVGGDAAHNLNIHESSRINFWLWTTSLFDASVRREWFCMQAWWTMTDCVFDGWANAIAINAWDHARVEMSAGILSFRWTSCYFSIFY